MTTEQAENAFWKTIKSVPAKIGAVGAIFAALLWTVQSVIKIDGEYQRFSRAIDKVEKLSDEMIDVRDELKAIAAKTEASYKPPIRFAEYGSTVEPAPPGGLAVVTWHLYVNRDDCPRPVLRLNSTDSSRVVRRVDVGDFQPVKLEAGPRLQFVSYEVIAPEGSDTGVGSLWAEVDYSCPNGADFPLRTPSIPWRILPLDPEQQE